MKRLLKNSMQIKENNKEYIRECIKGNPSSAKLDVAKLTGLSVATCGNILNEMLEKGEVLPVGQMPSNGGRPASQYIYNVNYSYVLCMYLGFEAGISTIAYAVSNMVGEAIEQEKKIVDEIEQQVIEDIIKGLIDKYKKISSIGIGVPGEVQDGVIEYCDITCLRNVRLKEKIEKFFDGNIFIENDMDFITYGFYKKRDPEKDENIAVIYFSKDNFPGAGVIVDGSILRGCTMFAGELTYLAIGFGISREEQLKQFNDEKTFSHMAARFVVPVISIINPKTIALMGNLINDDNANKIRGFCEEVIPEKHMPEIIVESSVHENYMKGLIAITLENTRL